MLFRIEGWELGNGQVTADPAPTGQETTATAANPANSAGATPAPSSSADQFGADTLMALLTAQESSASAQDPSTDADKPADGAAKAAGHHHHHRHAPSATGSAPTDGLAASPLDPAPSAQA